MLTKMMKKPYIVLALILILAVISTNYLGDDTVTASVDSNIAEMETAIAGSAADSDDGNHDWGNPRTLADHFARHGGDFDAENEQDYARQAHEFYENRADYQVKMEDGVARVYDSETNTFGAYNPDGTTRTFYKPSGGQAYFDRQPGK